MARRFASAALYMLVANAIMACVITVLGMAFVGRASWTTVRWMMTYNLVYANCIGGLAAIVVPWIAPPLWRHNPFLRWTLLTLVVAVITFAGCLAAVVILHQTGLTGGTPFGSYFWRSHRTALVITLAIGTVLTLIEAYRHQMDSTRQTLARKEQERQQLEKLAAEAQLASIESRVHPHFLFNTLNSISSLIRDDPEKAENLIERLAAVLRGSLDTPANGVMPLRREIRLVEDYLAIQSARFGDRLRYAVDVPEHLGAVAVPPFSVQTLVENSVKYAIAPHRTGARVRVSADIVGDRVIVDVWDDGPGFTETALISGHGLDSQQARLKVLFGGEAALEYARSDDGMSV